MVRILLIVGCIAVSIAGYGQKQLVLLKGQKILLRLTPGDEVIFSLKGSKTKRISYVNNLYDTALVAHKDVIPLHRIDRLYFDQSNFRNVVGGLLVLGGVGYLAIDQVNLVLVNDQPASLDERVWVPSAMMIGVGLPMLLIRKKSQRIGGRYRLLVVDRGSPFYQPERKSVNSLYFPSK